MAITKLAIPQGPGVTIERLANSLQVHLDVLVNQINKLSGSASSTATVTHTVGGNIGGQVQVNIPNPLTVPVYISYPGTGTTSSTTSFTSLSSKGLVQGYIVGTVTTTTFIAHQNAIEDLSGTGTFVLGSGTIGTMSAAVVNATNANIQSGTATLGSIVASNASLGTTTITVLSIGNQLPESAILNLVSDLAGKANHPHDHQYTYVNGTTTTTSFTGPD